MHKSQYKHGTPKAVIIYIIYFILQAIAALQETENMFYIYCNMFLG